MLSIDMDERPTTDSLFKNNWVLTTGNQPSNRPHPSFSSFHLLARVDSNQDSIQVIIRFPFVDINILIDVKQLNWGYI